MSYSDDLLDAARRLLTRRQGQKGKLPRAKINRSISTSYYALFHFLAAEAGRSIIGTRNDLRRRRRILFRVFTHSGIKLSLEKVKGAVVEPSVAEFLRGVKAPTDGVVSPSFARAMAASFVDAQAKRHDADYDLNVTFSEADARLIRSRVRRSIRDWQRANTPVDREFKRAFYVLMMLNGKLRKEI